MASNLSGLQSLVARNADGTGNNIANPAWGSAGSTYLRVTENSYGSDDGLLWDVPAEAGGTAPNARDISDIVLAQRQEFVADRAGLNEFLQFFGQFYTHDQAAARGGNGSERVNVAGIPTPASGAPSFNRDAFIIDGDGVRQHINNQTSYLDLSQVYGASQSMTDLLRADDSAKLVMGANDLLPRALDIITDSGISEAQGQAVFGGSFNAASASFLSGDARTNQQPLLIANHTIWARNHNWHVDQFEKQFGGTWSDDQIFAAARALNEAEWQHVVLDEYAVALFGRQAFSRYRGYDRSENAAITNEYTTVANRFGHDQSRNGLQKINEDGSVASNHTLGGVFGTGIATDTDMAQWLRGILLNATQEVDGHVADGNRNLLFGREVNDLTVFDTMRGRDHGVGDYNALREGLGMRTYSSFDQFGRANRLSTDTLDALKQAYGNDISQLDSIVGGLVEKKAQGSILGETFTELGVMQFEALCDGDRFFYLNRFKGDPELLKSVESTSMADIIVRNTDVKYVYRDAFATPNYVAGSAGNDPLGGTRKADLMVGLDGNDAIRGRDGDDDLHGGGGDDLLDGQGGDDFVFGDEGNDRLFGGLGRDHLDGGGGDDQLNGGRQNDVYAFGPDSGHDTITGWDREDTIDLSRVSGFESFTAVKAAMRTNSRNTVIALSADDSITLENSRLGDFHAANFDLTDAFLIA